MKLTVIGFWGGYPAPNGATSSYLLEKDGFSLLIDAGSGSLSKLQQYLPATELDAVILSHYHEDHIADIGVLQYAKLVNYYVNGLDRILPIYGHELDKKGFASLSHEYTEGRAYQPDNPITIGPFTISFLETNHPVPCFGMRITDGEHTVVYTADTSFKEEWIPFSEGADLLITDCNFYAEQDGEKAGHMTSKQGGEIANKAGVKTLVLSHLPQYGDRDQLIKEAKEEYNGSIHLATEGLVWQP
ncbi:MBL fold metallo-hydrolase [Oceanobacillus kapialis]|uniref:MBL fold metallo-hydrolase n=1 Tax=Oceanobacillus kapialis TaxID=481353 RepID=A0ABW5Q3V4_9BACI